VIELEGAGKRFSNVWAVRGLTCKVQSGEIFGLLGPNAAGKTTAIRMMTGLVRPTEGRILIGGHDIVSEPLSAKSVTGYVPDKTYLYEKLTGREFLAFVSSLHGIEKHTAYGRMERLLDLMGIRDAENELIESYSHGMRQRLIFCSALIHSPKALIIDEPFVGLDPYGVRTIKGLMRDLASEGVSVFLATHSLHIVQDLCHRVGIIQGGSLVSTISREEFDRESGGLEEMFIRLTS
jgi:ABC-2 type transport system ATP-binding protein